MKKLVQYIYEDLDVDNLIWKIEVYFKRHTKEYEQFVSIVQKCAKDMTVSKDNLDQYLKNTDIKVKSFIDFLYDNMDFSVDDKDYLYLLKKVIENVLANKSLEM